MGARTPKGILIAAVLWVTILAGIAATVRYLILPGMHARRNESLAEQTGSEGRYKVTVRLAADSFSGYCLLRHETLAQRLGRDGIKLEVQDDGADYMRRMRNLRDGRVEMAVFPVSSFLQCGAALGEFPASIIYVIDETKGADAVVARKDSVASIADLNTPNGRIVVTPDSPSEFLARVMLASFNLPELSRTRWMIKADGSAEVFKRFRGQSRRQPIAYAMWEPYVSRALQEEGAHVLLDSSKLKGFIVDVLVARRDFLIDNYEAAGAVLEAYARTAFASQGHMPEIVMEDAAAGGESLGRAAAEQIVRGIEWKNSLENYAHFGLQGDTHALENIEDIILKVTDVLVQTGALEGEALSEGANSLFFDKLLHDMKAARFHPARDLDILGDADPGGAALAVRETRALKSLSVAQWESLVTVGELRVRPIRFGRGTSRLTVQSQHDLAALSATLQSWPQYYLTVIGRVRPSGDETAALALAGQRASATVKRLESSGVAAARIRAKAEIGAADTADAQSVSFVVGELPY